MPVITDLPAGQVLSVRNLSVSFRQEEGVVQAVKNLSLDVQRGETLAIVGESGSGKSVTSLALMRLVEQGGGSIDSGEMWLRRRNDRIVDLASARQSQLRTIRGADMAMIFQEPMTSLNPVFPVGEQIAESIRLHQGKSHREALQEAERMLDLVRIPEAKNVLTRFPHQLSGGMRQRVMIAMALSCRPALLIADEPTTALDVTIQAQIIELLLELQQQENMALILITHDLALVAEAAHHIIVMYAGQVVETGKAVDIFKSPRHPYTQALLRALPEFAADKARLASLPGVVPGKYDRPQGCLLNPRCPYANDRCRVEEPELRDIPGRQSKCHYPLDDAGRPTYEA
jgi:oligopeptide/dipeptide ABC transporter ATP-binding protein